MILKENLRINKPDIGRYFFCEDNDWEIVPSLFSFVGFNAWQRVADKDANRLQFERNPQFD